MKHCYYVCQPNIFAHHILWNIVIHYYYHDCKFRSVFSATTTSMISYLLFTILAIKYAVAVFPESNKKHCVYCHQRISSNCIPIMTAMVTRFGYLWPGLFSSSNLAKSCQIWLFLGGHIFVNLASSQIWLLLGENLVKLCRISVHGFFKF